MPVDKLSIYNNACSLLGERKLDSLTEITPVRFLLDTVYDFDAIPYCLEKSRPIFASKTIKLDSFVASTVHDLDNVFTLPSDYITLVERGEDLAIYSDTKLDDPISRFIVEGRTIACEYSTIYVRYISDSYDLADFDASFARVVSAFLARELAPRINSNLTAELVGVFKMRVNDVLSLNKETINRSTKTTLTLDDTWRHIFNDALLILGLDELVSNSDDSNRRVKIETALNAGLVESVMDDTGWQFGKRSQQMDFNPSIEPEFGHQRGFNEPDDMLRLDGIYVDEYLQNPIKAYQHEEGIFFCEYDIIYIQYIHSDYISTPASWPRLFKRLIAGRIAKDVAMALKADVDHAAMEYDKRDREARSTDAMQSPPLRIKTGDWVRTRLGGYSDSSGSGSLI